MATLLLTGAGKGVEAFTPLSLGPSIWLDASMIPGLNDGDGVGTWADLSTHGHDATQATGSKKPLFKTNVANGKSGVLYDGVDDDLQFSGLSLSANRWTAFFACKPNTTGGNHYIFDSATGRLIFSFASAGPSSGKINYYIGTWTSQATAADTSAQIGTFDIGAGEIDLNGTALATGLATASTMAIGGTTSIGSSQGGGAFFSGHIFEFILVSGVLTAAQKLACVRYLGVKWGVTTA